MFYFQEDIDYHLVDDLCSLTAVVTLDSGRLSAFGLTAFGQEGLLRGLEDAKNSFIFTLWYHPKR